MLHFFGACSKKIYTKLKVVHGASTKWCVVLGAWPKTMVWYRIPPLVASFNHRGRMVVAVTDLNAERKKHVKQQALHSRLQRDLADVQSQLQGAFLYAGTG